MAVEGLDSAIGPEAVEILGDGTAGRADANAVEGDHSGREFGDLHVYMSWRYGVATCPAQTLQTGDRHTPGD